MVVSGPFAGVTGAFVRYRGRGRVVVNIEALGQYAAVEVSEDDIEVIRDNLLINCLTCYLNMFYKSNRIPFD